jgi:hypothetical protein
MAPSLPEQPADNGAFPRRDLLRFVAALAAASLAQPALAFGSTLHSREGNVFEVRPDPTTTTVVITPASGPIPGGSTAFTVTGNPADLPTIVGAWPTTEILTNTFVDEDGWSWTVTRTVKTTKYVTQIGNSFTVSYPEVTIPSQVVTATVKIPDNDDDNDGGAPLAMGRARRGIPASEWWQSLPTPQRFPVS